MLKFVCMHCAETFEGNAEKFCSQACRDSHISILDQNIRKAVESDSSHTRKLIYD